MSRTNTPTGQNLVEFAILLIIITIGAIVALSLFGRDVNTTYKKSSDTYATFEPFKFGQPSGGSTSTTVTGGSIGGSSSAPASQCNNGSCDIDFGDFAVTGVPENYSSFVETSGAAGGIALLSDILKQIADQMAQSGDTKEAADLKNLANLGHLLSDYQKQIEADAASCKTAPIPNDCFHEKYINGNISVNMNPELSSILSNFQPANQNTLDMTHYMSFFNARYDKKTNSAQFEERKSQYPSYAMVDAFDKIMADPKYSDNVKGIADMLFRNIGEISQEFQCQATTLNNASGLGSRRIDPVTGEYGEFIDYTFDSATAVDNVLHPNASTSNNLSSALLCVTGQNRDTGVNCYNK